MKRFWLPKHKKFVFTAIGSILLLARAVGFVLRPPKDIDGDAIWREYPVGRGDITASLDGSGKLEFTEVSHGFDAALKIEEIFAEVGQEVKKGDKLVQYSKEDIEKKIEELKRAFETAERSLQDIQNGQQAEKLQNNLAHAQSQQQAQNAYETSKREYETSIQELEQQVRQLQETVDSLKQALKEAEQSGSEDVAWLQSELNRWQEELAALEASAQTEPEETNLSQTDSTETTTEGEEAQSGDTAVLIQEKKNQIADIQARIDAASEKESQIASLNDRIKQAQSELDAAKKQLEGQKTALANLKSDYDRQNSQNAQNQGIQNQIDSLNNASKNNAVKNAQAQVDKARADLEAAEKLLDTPVLTAHTDGIVTAINCLPGEEVPAGKSIVQIGNNGDKQVIVQISQEDIGAVEVGQQVEMRFVSNPEEAVNGKVSEKSLLPTEGGDGVTYKVLISLDEDHPELMEGMTCTTKFILKRVEGVLTLANKAITLRDGKQYVTVKLSDGSHEEREIKTGFSDGRVSEIVSGLSEGDSVVVEG